MKRLVKYNIRLIERKRKCNGTETRTTQFDYAIILINKVQNKKEFPTGGRGNEKATDCRLCESILVPDRDFPE